MSERAEHKGWAAAAIEAFLFYCDHGGDNMSPGDRARHDQLIAAAQEAAARHDEARNNGLDP